MTRAHFRTCTLCEAMCGVRIEHDGREVLSIRGDDDDPFSRGHICPKALALADIHTDPDRLRHPVRREGDRWVRVPWDEALDETATRLHEVQRRHGLDAVGVYLGNPNVHNLGAMLYGPRLLRALRTKNRYSATSCDQLPHMLASYLMFGHQLLLPVPDVDRTDYFLVLGANPIASNGSLMTAPGIRERLRALRERGGKLVVVDPRRTETARIADEHVFVRPGTDAVLLLALLNEILSTRGARLGHLEASCEGLATLTAACARFPAERAAAATGIDAGVIRRLAGELADADRGVCYGRMGASTQEFGALCQWLVNAINIVCGHFDRPGGAMLARPAVDAISAPRGFGLGRGSFGRWRSAVRGLPEFGGELPSAALAEEMLADGPRRIRGMIVLAGNPVLSTPNGTQLDRALGTLEFMVAVDLYVNETSRHADLILPPTSPLERSHYDVAFHLLAVRNTAKYSPALFDPPSDARHDWQITTEIERRLLELRHGRVSKEALASRAVARLGPERLLDAGLRLGPYGARLNPGGRGLSLRRLRREPHGVDLGPLEPCLPDRLPRQHRRVELAPEPFVADLDRLDARVDDATPRRLTLIGRRHVRSNNSWCHNVPHLMRGRSRCTLMMHPADAARAGLADRDPAVVASRVGEVLVPVEVTADVMEGVVSLPHGFGHGREGVLLRVATEHAGVSVNDLTDELHIDAASGNAAFSGVPVTVRQADQANEGRPEAENPPS